MFPFRKTFLGDNLGLVSTDCFDGGDNDNFGTFLSTLKISKSEDSEELPPGKIFPRFKAKFMLVDVVLLLIRYISY